MLFRISRCFFCNSCDSLYDSLVTAYLQHELLQLVLHVTFLGRAPGLRALRDRALRLLLGPDCVLESAVLIKILDQMLLQSLLLVVKQKLLLEIELLREQQLLRCLKYIFLVINLLFSFLVRSTIYFSGYIQQLQSEQEQLMTETVQDLSLADQTFSEKQKS